MVEKLKSEEIHEWEGGWFYSEEQGLLNKARSGLLLSESSLNDYVKAWRNYCKIFRRAPDYVQEEAVKKELFKLSEGLSPDNKIWDGLVNLLPTLMWGRYKEVENYGHYDVYLKSQKSL
jgi:hypothetical protein